MKFNFFIAIFTIISFTTYANDSLNKQLNEELNMLQAFSEEPIIADDEAISDTISLKQAARSHSRKLNKDSLKIKKKRRKRQR